MRTLLVIAMAGLVSTNVTTAQTVNLGSLADELANRDNLAIHPNGRYTQHQASSHDPRNALGQSTLGAPWGFLNVDFGNYLRQEVNEGRQEFVLLEDTGPGVITRWWSTGISGELLSNNRFRIYIDGATSPAVTATASNLVGGNNNGFGTSLNFATPNLGGNLYGPIAYNSGIKITWDGPTTHGTHSVADRAPNLDHSVANALWYNINYRKLAPGTSVASYSTSDTTTYQSNLETVNNRLVNPSVTGSVTNQHSVAGQQLAPGQAISHALHGTGAIRRLMLNVAGGDQASALKDAIVELRFDGQTTARVPAGHFFANGVSRSLDDPFNTGSNYMQQVSSNGDMTSYFVMPYESDAQIRIINNGSQPLDIDLEVDSGNWTWDENSMHFHANYRKEDNIRTPNVGAWPGSPAAGNGYSGPGAGDFRFLSVRGKGVLVGDVLSVDNTSNVGGNGWWGEGDEKIYVDYLDGNGKGHTTAPVHLGTGTEDYYGYSFGSGTTFASPFVGQPVADAQGGGAPTVNSRVRGLDAIPFNESFKFDMEVWKWLDGNVDFDTATFWYGRPGAVALNTVADLAADFPQANNGAPASGIEDTTGNGHWEYFSSDRANPSTAGADVQTLTWGNVGNAGNQGFGGGENGSNNLAAISNEFLFVDGGDNIGIQGAPGYHELALHPGGDNFEGNANRDYLVARWTAGESVDRLINVSGSLRNLIGNGDSVDFFIYVNGELEFSASGGSSTLDETPFDFDSFIVPGQTVDFVLGNGGGNNPFGDESLLRAIISADYLPPIELVGDLDGDGTISAADWQILRDNFNTAIGDLNDDGITNVEDFGIFKEIYIATHGANAFASLLTVPEPSALAIGGLLLALSSAVRCF